MKLCMQEGKVFVSRCYYVCDARVTCAAPRDRLNERTHERTNARTTHPADRPLKFSFLFYIKRHRTIACLHINSPRFPQMCRFHRENIEKIKIIKIKKKGGRKATPPDEIVNFSATGRHRARESLSLTDTQSTAQCVDLSLEENCAGKWRR